MEILPPMLQIYFYVAALYCLYTGCRGLVIIYNFCSLHDRNIKNIILIIIGVIASIFCLYAGGYILIFE
ncbi:unnamed protein product [marine sediment metagenome]|uniref:Uncharacterized protein n=1 Tax=marine sediment metagenome TaxID=412755 RepID=X0VDF3_9ZZZZ